MSKNENMSLREYIWERCEMDDIKTDEILSAIIEEIKKVVPANRKCPTHEDKFQLGCNGCDRYFFRETYRAGLLDTLDNLNKGEK